MLPRHTPHNASAGFTLVELSIVLVIVSLIIGAILVGRDLMSAAELRATISQVEKYNAAVNTFRTKFGALPGDILSSDAVAFGLFSETTLAGTAGHQDGNGLIEGGAIGATTPAGETLSFWRHLSDANLIDGALGLNPADSLINAGTGTVTATVNSPSHSLPQAKFSPADYFVVFAAGGFNYFEIMAITTITTAPAYTFVGPVNPASLTPIQAYNIDSKLDDGLPQAGLVVARSTVNVNLFATFSPVSQSNTCEIGFATAADTYNRVPATGGNDKSCSLRFRFN
jgi:prepilin-type N-terminal cleavage/methylation domain-containing protein